MNSPPVPTPEMRKRIAIACGWERHGELGIWEPEHSEVFWKALVRKVAQLIESHIDSLQHVATEYLPKAINYVENLLRRSNQATATNDVSALESLCFELMEKSDE